ncbi:hypothetical protein N9T73_00395 [bacterium]|nr:hypothetical protein [bacterium]
MFYANGINKYKIDMAEQERKIFKSQFGHEHKSIHAEEDAINQLKKSEKTKKVDICIFRTNRYGDKLMMAKPCCNCQRVIKNGLKYKNYKLRHCWFTNEEGEFEKIKI